MTTTQNNNVNLYQSTSTVTIYDLHIIGHDGKTWTLINQFAEVVLYEDLFGGLLSGSILVFDTMDYINRVPLDGWQQVVIDFQTNSNANFQRWKKTFRISKVSALERVANASSTRSYLIELASEFFNGHLNTRIFQAYNSMTESAIVGSVCTNQLAVPSNQQFIEATKYSRNFAVPGWKPLDVITECCQTAVRGSGYEAANYVFYESLKGVHFTSLDSLAAQTPDPMPITNAVVTNLDITKAHVARRQAEEVHGQTHQNFVFNSMHGGFHTKMLGVDIYSKTFQEFDWDYKTEFPNLQKIDSSGNLPYTSHPLPGKHQHMIVAPWQSTPRGYASDHSSRHVPKRASMMTQWGNASLNVHITGDSSLFVGQKVLFKFPQSNAFVSNQAEDGMLSGSYIISAIRNHFDKTTHSQILNLRKGSLRKSAS